jgi:flagellar basal body-associated protein FliL
MNDHTVPHEHDGRAFHRKLIWLALIKVIVLVLIGLFIAFYLL